MPMAMLRLIPGLNAEVTPSQLEAGYASCQYGRFRAGLFEKLGGWVKYVPYLVSGIPRALASWQDRNATDYLGVGTTHSLGVITNGNLSDLTPQTLVSNFAPDFTTDNGTPNIVVSDPNIDTITIFDTVEFLTPVSVDGFILSGSFPIDLNLGTNEYRILANTNATSTVTSGGVVPVFTTVAGESPVTVSFPNNGLAKFSTITFPIPTTVGGVTIEGTYTVITVLDADTFTISANVTAASSDTQAMNGGDVRVEYYIAIGPVASGQGYSVGAYSEGAYSTGVAGAGQQTGTPITAVNWTLDNWGDIFLACPQDGPIFQWQPGTGIQNAQMLGSAPAHNTGMFVAMQVQMLICYGSSIQNTIGIAQNPLAVVWSDVGDYTSFQTSTTSQAGSRILSSGSKIVFGMACPLQELIWTDLDIWSMQYLGSLQAGVWSFTKIGANCGLIGRHAAVAQGSNVYWMGISNFFICGIGGGSPQAIPCNVWDVVFQNLNTDYQDKCWAWSNTPFNEIWFFFPRASTSATECDFYVKVNTLTGLWDYGPMPRTCGIDQSVLGMPISATPTGQIYQHETSRDADGQPMTPSFVTGWFPISEGQDIVFSDWFLPDMKWGLYGGSQDATLQATFETVYYPGETPRVYGPYTFTQATQYLNPRLRGRLCRFTISSNDLGSWWRIGGCRYRFAPDGRLP